MGLFEKRVVFGAAFLALSILVMVAIALRRTGRETQEALLSRSMGPVVSLIEAAHRAQDDPALQRLVHAMAVSPGMIWAGVLDAKEKRFVVHSDPVQIGEPWKGESVSWTAPLENGDALWGHLIVGFTPDVLGRFQRRLFLWGAGGGAVFVFLSVLQAGYGFHQKKRFQAETSDAAAVQDELQEALAKAHHQAQERDIVSSQCLQSALEQIPRPCLFLDRHQRVAACNSMAPLLLGAGLPAEWMGRPWQDIPMLADCGKPLAESLENPQRTFRVTLLSRGVTIDWWSLAAVSGISPGTWVTLYPTST